MADGESPPLRKRDRLKARARRYATVPLSVRTSDLPKRAASAVVMLLVAGGALWLGGLAWRVFVIAIALGVFWEWFTLVSRFCRKGASLAAWMLGGIAYIGVASWTLLDVREASATYVLMIAGAVIATDIGAYFTGRAIGGPKIAPRISPSKTWAGLAGGAVAATAFLALFVWASFVDRSYVPTFMALALAVGPLCAVVAQAGDFFESWMKRRAGMKDSGRLIPGHGGLFDRVDGLMAVCLLGFPLAWIG